LRELRGETTRISLFQRGEDLRGKNGGRKRTGNLLLLGGQIFQQERVYNSPFLLGRIKRERGKGCVSTSNHNRKRNFSDKKNNNGSKYIYKCCLGF